MDVATRLREPGLNDGGYVLLLLELQCILGNKRGGGRGKEKQKERDGGRREKERCILNYEDAYPVF